MGRLGWKQTERCRAHINYRCNRHFGLIIPTEDSILGPFKV
jgi:hypothetical protein